MGVVAIRRDLKLLGSDDLDAILAHNAAQKCNWPFFFSGVDKSKPQRLWPAKQPFGALQCYALPISEVSSFSTLPSAREVDRFVCEAARSLSQRARVSQHKILKRCFWTHVFIIKNPTPK